MSAAVVAPVAQSQFKVIKYKKQDNEETASSSMGYDTTNGDREQNRNINMNELNDLLGI